MISAYFFFSLLPCPPISTLFPYTTLFRSERFDELPDDLDRCHDERHQHRTDTRDPGRHEHDRLEVALGPERDEARHLDGHERGQRERAGHRQVAGRGGAPGKQTEQVAVENEEEEREDVRGELLAAVTDVGDRDVVSYEQ